MGMGKTAVMISLMRMPPPAAWADTLAVPEAWDDAYMCVQGSQLLLPSAA